MNKLTAIFKVAKGGGGEARGENTEREWGGARGENREREWWRRARGENREREWGSKRREQRESDGGRAKGENI